MSQINEARYGRACLLVLNTCPVTLRRIIDHHSKGFNDLEGLLNHRRNLHDLFHLSFRQCCCGHNTNYTPMRKQQWDLLYTKRYSHNPHGQNGQCPCMYTAIPGVTSDVMDITLCCLVLRNICRGINNADIDAVIDVRNKLIHTQSAALDDRIFNDLWNKVETAILNLALKGESTLRADTKTAIEEMRDRIMNPDDLRSLRELVLDQKVINELVERIDKLEATQTTHKTNPRQFPEEKVKQLREVLLRINIRAAKNIQISPLLKMGKKLQIGQIYAPLSIKEKSETNTYKLEDENDIRFLQTLHTSQRANDYTGLPTEATDYSMEQLDEFTDEVDDSLDEANGSSYEVDDSSHEGSIKNIQMVQTQHMIPTSTEMDRDGTDGTLDRVEMDNTEESNNPTEQRRDIEESEMQYPTTEIDRPQQMFYNNGEPVRYIFLEGEAGRGKTMFSRQLIQYWCTAKLSSAGRDDLTVWEKGLDEFDFVFPVLLRHVNRNRFSLIDMICYDLFKHNSACEDAIRHVISSDKYRCLFVIDGLDEWNISKDAKTKLTHDGFPIIEGTSCCSFLFTFRPWKLLEVADLIEPCDKVLQIDGITCNGVIILIENVLLNYYGMQRGTLIFDEMKYNIKLTLNENIFKSIIEIPLLVTVCTMLLCEKGQLGNNLTSLYISLVQFLIKENIQKQCLDTTTINALRRSIPTDVYVPKILLLNRNRSFSNFMEVLNKLGLFAYRYLLSAEGTLTFSKEDLEEEMGELELDFAFKVGLLSQCEAPGCFDEENVSVNFFHKNIQEFLVALHIVYGNKSKTEEFCKHLGDVQTILQLTNVIIFISGLSSSVGNIILEHIAHVTDNDKHVLKWRSSFDISSLHRMRNLNRLFLICFLEMKYSLDNESSVLKFHGKDISMTLFDIKREHAYENANLLRESYSDGIVSLFVTPPHFKSDILSDFLLRSHSLQSLYMNMTGDIFSRINSVGYRLPLKNLHMHGVTLTPDAWDGLIMSLRVTKQLRILKMGTLLCTDESSRLSFVNKVFAMFTNVKKLPALGTSDRCSHVCAFFKTLADCHDLSILEFESGTLRGEKGKKCLIDVLRWLKNLEEIRYIGTGKCQKFSDVDTEIFHEILNISHIRQVQVRNIDQTIFPPNKPQEFLPKWTQIALLILKSLFMDAWRWLEFIHSLEKLQCELNVTLIDTNISDEAVRWVKSSPHFRLSFEKKNCIGFMRTPDNPINVDSVKLYLEKAKPIIII